MYQCFYHFVCQSFLQLFFQRFAQYVHALPQPLVGFIGVVDADVVAPAVLAGVKNVSGDQRDAHVVGPADKALAVHPVRQPAPDIYAASRLCITHAERRKLVELLAYQISIRAVDVAKF